MLLQETLLVFSVRHIEERKICTFFASFFTATLKATFTMLGKHLYVKLYSCSNTTLWLTILDCVLARTSRSLYFLLKTVLFRALACFTKSYCLNLVHINSFFCCWKCRMWRLYLMLLSSWLCILQSPRSKRENRGPATFFNTLLFLFFFFFVYNIVSLLTVPFILFLLIFFVSDFLICFRERFVMCMLFFVNDFPIIQLLNFFAYVLAFGHHD